MNKPGYFLMASWLLASSGCSWLTNEDDGFFRDRSNDYQKAEVVPALDIPASIDSSNTEALLVIPASEAQLKQQDFVLPAPPKLSGGLHEQSLRIQKLGQQRWILIDKPADELWPRVRDFLLVNNLPIGLEQGDKGQLETRWLLSQHDDSIRERFRFSVTAGVQRNSAEVHIVQQQMPRAKPAVKTWPQNSVETVREYWMLDQLSDFLVNAEGAPSVSLLAQDISAAPRLSLVVKNNQNPYLALNLTYRRAWATTALALKKAEFAIDERQADKNRYLTTFAPPASEDQQPGFLARLFGAKPVLYAEQAFAGDKITIEVKPVPSGAEIRVINTEKAYTAKQQEAILNLFKGYLS